jgi:hypothetical protein
VGLHQCLSERKGEGGPVRGLRLPSHVPSPRKMPPKCGAFPVQPRRSPLRQTACWRKPDSNRWSHFGVSTTAATAPNQGRVGQESSKPSPAEDGEDAIARVPVMRTLSALGARDPRLSFGCSGERTDCGRVIEVGGQLEAPDALARRPVELVDVGPVFVGNEHALPVVRDADRFGIEARAVRVARVLARVEVIGTPGEIELAGSVLRRCSRPEAEPGAAAVD